MWGGRGVSAGHPCSAHALPCLLRYAAKRAVRIMPLGGSMLDETGFYAPSVAHNALPGRPWPGISVFLGHNSTVSMQLRYSPAWECVCDARMPGAYDAYVVTVIYDFRYNKYSRSKYQRYLNLGGLCYNTIMP